MRKGVNDPIVDDGPVATNAPSFEHTTERVIKLRQSSRLLFWSLVVPPVVAEAYGFGVGILGYPYEYLKYAPAITAAGHVLALLGTIGILRALRTDDERTRLLGTTLVILVCVTLLGKTSATIGRLTQPDALGPGWVVLTLSLLAHIGWVVVGSLLFRRLSLGFGANRLAQRFIVAAWVYLAAFGGLWMGHWGPQLHPSLAAGSAVRFATWFVWIGASVYGFVILHRFCRMTRWLLKGQCLDCAYPLQGLPSRRCPECGTVNLPAPAEGGSAGQTGDNPV